MVKVNRLKGSQLSIFLEVDASGCFRVITIKRICADDARYKIKPTHKLVIRAEHQLIDFNKEIVIQGNYSTRTLQSDGKKWWIINRSGS